MYGTGDHIDEFCRFVGPHTILLAEVTEAEARTDPIAAENKKRLDRNYEILKSATDQDGKPFKIVRIPAAESEYLTLTKGDTIHEFSGFLFGENGHKGNIHWIPAKSYCNFLITNGVVLAAKYWMPGMPDHVKTADRKALAVMKTVFPNRKIIPINPMAVNIGGGGIHCITMQEPAIR